MKKFYAGIGSRETPESARPLIQKIVTFLHEEGYTLRSGGAPGADEMFETAHKAVTPDKTLRDIYLPWYCFQSNYSPLCIVTEEAIDFSLQFHPAPHALKQQGVRKLMGRNAYQVLGLDLKTKADFIVCWTHNGADSDSDADVLRTSGGTGQAIRIAVAYKIPVYNLQSGGIGEFKKWYSDHNFDIM